MEALAQPRSSDEKLRSMPVLNWHLEHLSKLKSRQKTLTDFCEFFKNQEAERDGTVAKEDLNAYLLSSGLE